jgi:hypothetical protein
MLPIRYVLKKKSVIINFGSPIRCFFHSGGGWKMLHFHVREAYIETIWQTIFYELRAENLAVFGS